MGECMGECRHEYLREKIFMLTSILYHRRAFRIGRYQGGDVNVISNGVNVSNAGVNVSNTGVNAITAGFSTIQLW